MSKERELLKRVYDSTPWLNSSLKREIEKTLSQQDRKEVLLKAAYELLKECNESIYVLNAMAVGVFYIAAELDIDE
jgi:hypothetical protein